MSKIRCPWVADKDLLYTSYHDTEWGVPVYDDAVHFEFLILEGAQAGLSWETILKRREGYRNAFAGFDPDIVAGFGESDIDRLLVDVGIIRNRLKIRSAINNARKFLVVQEEFGSFTSYIWSFVDYQPLQHMLEVETDYPAFTPESENLSTDLKTRGFTFVGPTIMYAHMQATGLVNDHVVDCYRYLQTGE